MTGLLTGANHHVQYQAKQLPVPEVQTAHPHQHWHMQRSAKKRDKDIPSEQMPGLKMIEGQTESTEVTVGQALHAITGIPWYTPPFLSANTLMILPIESTEPPGRCRQSCAVRSEAPLPYRLY